MFGRWLDLGTLHSSMDSSVGGPHAFQKLVREGAKVRKEEQRLSSDLILAFPGQRLVTSLRTVDPTTVNTHVLTEDPGEKKGADLSR